MPFCARVDILWHCVTFPKRKNIGRGGGTAEAAVRMRVEAVIWPQYENGGKVVTAKNSADGLTVGARYVSAYKVTSLFILIDVTARRSLRCCVCWTEGKKMEQPIRTERRRSFLGNACHAPIMIASCVRTAAHSNTSAV